MMLDRFLPQDPLVVGMDDTIEHRAALGAKITARGIYRDPVRSSHGHFVKASGLRRLSFMAMIPLPLGATALGLAFFDHPGAVPVASSRRVRQGHARSAAGRMDPPAVDAEGSSAVPPSIVSSTRRRAKAQGAQARRPRLSGMPCFAMG
jgi:hypothetical protein